ncbi:ATP-grasp domain-containing protein [Flagellimonas flava]|uniref:Glutathione synthetase, ATP-grasp domain n=1 Tax=Flagellimonas flava TaxID=570519 RepID=A0A1M5II08_9FLAO|nr:hypothetical protein [Allomuricauda flava]SHG27897.1 glutathione synthetase, ATP-grasp domain [Allomuricauda flava]
MAFDVVILSAPGYLCAKEGNPLLTNVVLEDQLVMDALTEKGLKVTRKSWDETNFDWSSTKFALFRSTWDYIHRAEEFSLWLEKVSQKTQLINSKELISWNFDKHYLQELSSLGISIPKTIFIEKDSKITLEEIYFDAIKNHGFAYNTLVLKPCVSGGARHTYKIEVKDIPSFEKTFQELIVGEAMMVQEFQQNIIDKGEISMMVFNGEFTHAVLKVAKQGDFRVQDDFGGTVKEYLPSHEEIQFAEKTVNAAPEMPMYARVDIFQDNSGNLALAELEIFEPELWFRLNPNAAKVLGKHIFERYFT